MSIVRPRQVDITPSRHSSCALEGRSYTTCLPRPGGEEPHYLFTTPWRGGATLLVYHALEGRSHATCLPRPGGEEPHYLFTTPWRGGATLLVYQEHDCSHEVHQLSILNSVNSSYLLGDPPESQISPMKITQNRKKVKKCSKFTPPSPDMWFPLPRTQSLEFTLHLVYNTI